MSRIILQNADALLVMKAIPGLNAGHVSSNYCIKGPNVLMLSEKLCSKPETEFFPHY
jgi:hypothetical protein